MNSYFVNIARRTNKPKPANNLPKYVAGHFVVFELYGELRSGLVEPIFSTDAHVHV